MACYISILKALCLIYIFSLHQTNACFSDGNSDNSSPSCGVVNPKFLDSHAKIINGNNAVPNSWPWMVSIRFNNNHLCGGSLIDQRFVLTAAHCIETRNLKDYQIIVGLHYVNQFNADQVYEVENIILNTKYNESNLGAGYDVALYKLKKAVVLSANVSLICLPSAKDFNVPIGQYATIIGFGRVDKSSDAVMADQLQQTKMKVSNNDAICKDQNYDSSQLYCLYDDTKTQNQGNACNGDSGGPLFYPINNKYYVFGIASYVLTTENGRCMHEEPSFYVNVPASIGWINSNRN